MPAGMGVTHQVPFVGIYHECKEMNIILTLFKKNFMIKYQIFQVKCHIKCKYCGPKHRKPILYRVFEFYLAQYVR